MTTTDVNWTEVLNGNDRPINWKGEEDGDSVWGIVVKYIDVKTKLGEDAKVLEIRNDDEEISYAIWPKKMLQGLLEKGEVAEGMMVKIVYEGKKKVVSSPGKTYRSYKLFVARV